MHCRHCGRRVPDDSRFCPSCGGSLSAQMRRPMPQGHGPTPQRRPVPVDGAPEEEACGPEEGLPKAGAGRHHMDSGAAYTFIQGRLDRIERHTDSEEEAKTANGACEEVISTSEVKAPENGRGRLPIGAAVLFVLIAALVVIAIVIVIGGRPDAQPPPRLAIGSVEVTHGPYKLYEDPITHQVTSATLSYHARVVLTNNDSRTVDLGQVWMDAVLKVDDGPEIFQSEIDGIHQNVFIHFRGFPFQHHQVDVIPGAGGRRNFPSHKKEIEVA